MVYTCQPLIHILPWRPFTSLSQVGVFLDALVRVELHHWEATLSVVNMGEHADIRV
jgi:hypothetical protein